jgi:hypothetical protein
MTRWREVRKRRRLELATSALAAVTAINAASGAAYGLAGARNVPREWLAGSPFADYRLPSLVLGAAVGGTSGAAAVTSWRGDEHAAAAAIAAGAVLTAWIAAQVAIIGLRSPLQPVMAGVGISLIGLGRRLR